MDGNKRTSFAATYTFLEINGWHLAADADATFAFLHERYESGDFSFPVLVAWLRANVQPHGR